MVVSVSSSHALITRSLLLLSPELYCQQVSRMATPELQQPDACHLVESGVFGFEDLSSSSTEMNAATPDDVLLKAVLEGDLESVRKALADGANIHVRSECKFTPLMHAVSTGNWEVLRLLLAEGADVHDDVGAYNVLMVLCDSTCEDDLSLLKCLNVLLEKGANPSAADWIGATPLVHAVRRNREQLALRLIDTGCSINAPDSEGWTPLFYAVQNNNVSIAQLLIDCGAKVNLMDRSGRALSHIAATTNNRELVKMVTSPLKPEFALSEPSTSTPERLQLSPFRHMLADGPKTNDRFYGFHDEAIQFLHGIGLGYVASVMSAKNIQLAPLLTWDDNDWSDADIRLSYHRNKILTCVRHYHEKEWSRNAIPDLSHVYEGGKVDLFKAVQALANFLRLTHISSASSLYLLKNFKDEQLSEDVVKELQSVTVALVVIKKQIPAIAQACRDLENTNPVLSPDLISDYKYVKSYRPPLLITFLACALSLRFLFKRNILSNLYRFLLSKN